MTEVNLLDIKNKNKKGSKITTELSLSPLPGSQSNAACLVAVWDPGEMQSLLRRAQIHLKDSTRLRTGLKVCLLRLRTLSDPEGLVPT